jgi:hypothetical protein
MPITSEFRERLTDRIVELACKFNQRFAEGCTNELHTGYRSSKGDSASASLRATFIPSFKKPGFSGKVMKKPLYKL